MGKKKTRFDWVRDAEEPVTPRVDRRSHRDRSARADRTDELVKTLEQTDPATLASVPLSSTSRHLLDEVLRLQDKGKSALRRSRLALSKALRHEDLDAVDEALGAGPGGTAREEALDDLVRWRDRILDQGDDAIQGFVDAYPMADRQRIRKLYLNATRGEAPPTKAEARALFDALKEDAGL